MIHASNTFPRKRDLDGVVIPKVEDIGSERKQVLQVVKAALKDFREKYIGSAQSYSRTLTEQKLNYLEELLKEKLSEVDFTSEIESFELTSTEKKQIHDTIKSQVSNLSEKYTNELIGQIESILNEKVSDNDDQKTGKKNSNGESKPTVDIGTEDGNFLEDYFDNLYKKSEKYDSLKQGIIDEMIEGHNENVRLVKERLLQYKDSLKSYEKKLKEANNKISKLRGEKNHKNKNEAIEKSGIHSKSKKEKEQKKNNLVEKNLLTQGIVDQIRKNEGMTEAPKTKVLDVNHIQFASNLVTKFYRNGKTELQLKRLKLFGGTFGKIFGIVTAPITFLVGKVWSMTKIIGNSIAKLGKMVIQATGKSILAAIMTPTGAYAIGFIAGYVGSWIKDKLQWDEKDGTGYLKNAFKIFMDGFVNPAIEIGKTAWKLINGTVKLITDHPLVFGGMIALLEGVKFMFQNFHTIKLGFNILTGKGLKLAIPMLAGIIVSSIVESIFDKTIFAAHNEAEKKLEYGNKEAENYAKFSDQLNGETISNLNAINNRKFTNLKKKMDDENMNLMKMRKHLKFVFDNFNDTNGQKHLKFSTLINREFINNIFDSPLYGNNEDGLRKYLNAEANPSINLDQLSTMLANELNNRQSMLAIQMGILTQSSQNGIPDMSSVLSDMTLEDEIKDENGNIVGHNVRMKDDFVDKFRDEYGNIHGTVSDGLIWGFNEKDASEVYNRYKLGITMSNDHGTEGRLLDTEVGRSASILRLASEVENNFDKEKHRFDIQSRYDAIEGLKDSYTNFTTKKGYNPDDFMHFVDNKTIYKIIAGELRNGNSRNIDKKLTQYFESVKGDYLRKSKNEKQQLIDDINDIDKDIEDKHKRTEDVNRQIRNLERHKRKGHYK